MKIVDTLFFKENGWASCFECDEIFLSLKELNEHEQEHINNEKLIEEKGLL